MMSYGKAWIPMTPELLSVNDDNGYTTVAVEKKERTVLLSNSRYNTKIHLSMSLNQNMEEGRRSDLTLSSSDLY